jgi:hypothetical protein
MEKPKIEYAARTAFHEERSASIIPAHIAAELERLNTETRSEDDEEELPPTPRVLRYRL